MRDVLVAVAYFPLQRFVAYVHSVSKHPSFKCHWISCVSLLTASITLNRHLDFGCHA